MTNFEVTALQFNAPVVNGIHRLRVNRSKWWWAALTVGTPRFLALVASPRYAVLRALNGVYTAGCLDFSGQHLKLHPNYWHFDQSEKVGISYSIGMSAAKIIAADILDTPWLIQASVLRRNGVLALRRPESKSLADLIGYSAGRYWHVMEAKGNQRPPSDAKRLKWKTQAGTVSRVNNERVRSNSYSATILTPNVRAEIVDPESKGENLEVITEGRESLLDTYYTGFLDLVAGYTSFERQVGGQSCRLCPVSLESDRVLCVGVNTSVIESKDVTVTKGFSAQTKEFEYMGTDGVAVALLSREDTDLPMFR